jgi:SAM-dependent methyltransferase
MTRVTSSITIDRPAAEVFDFIADMANNPLWQQGQESCEWTSEPPLQVGSTYAQRARFLGRTIESGFEVTELEPGQRIRIVATSGPMDIDVTREVRPAGPDRCEVSAVVAGDPPGLMKRAGGAVDKMVERSVAADYRHLKEIMEAPGELPPNHHANYPQFTGLAGYKGASKMVLGRGSDADLVVSLAELTTGTDLVDIGCGPGVAVLAAARAGAAAVGVDPSEPMLRTARMLTRLRPPQAGTVEWKVGGAEELPLADDSADVVWTLKALHHWPLLVEGLAEVVRVLRPAGGFIALETRTWPGATGFDSHGWTDQQAHTLAQMLRDHYGFVGVEVSEHRSGKKAVLVVQGQLG